MRVRGNVMALVGAVLVLAMQPADGAEAQVGRPAPGEEVPVTAVDLINKTANNSPILVADPTEPRFVVLANRLDSPDFGCALQVSGDRGRSWVGADPVAELPSGAEKCYAPEVAFDARGVLYYLFIGLHGAGNSPMGTFLTTSRDRGRSFTTPRRVLGPERYQVRMAIDPTVGRAGRIHLVWLQTEADPPLGGLPATPNPLMAAYSDDGGDSFSRPVQISDPERQRVVAPAVAVGPGRRVHVLYYDLQDDARDYQGLEGPRWEGRWSLVVTTSADGGRRYGRSIVVDQDVVPPDRVMLIFTMPPPALATDDAGRVYAAWHDARNGDWDVFLRGSPDHARTWDAPVRLNDDQVGNGRHQYLPRLSVAADGRVDAVFYDRRGNKENRGNDVYYTYSGDNGRTWQRNLKLTSLDSDSRIGPRYAVPSAQGLNEFGSRIALWSEPSGALVAWTDTRNTGRGFPAQDIYASAVTLSSVEDSERLGRLREGEGGEAVRDDTGNGGTRATLLLVPLALLATLGIIGWRRRKSKVPPEEVAP